MLPVACFLASYSGIHHSMLGFVNFTAFRRVSGPQDYLLSPIDADIVCCRSRLVPLHCCIVPMEHISSSRRTDEDVWTEIRNFKKCIILMYRAQVLNSDTCIFPLLEWRVKRLELRVIDANCKTCC